MILWQIAAAIIKTKTLIKRKFNSVSIFLDETYKKNIFDEANGHTKTICMIINTREIKQCDDFNS